MSSSGRGQWPCPDVTNAPGNRSPLPQYTRSTNTKGLFINDVIVIMSSFGYSQQKIVYWVADDYQIFSSVQMLFFVFKFDMTFECV